MSRQVPSAVNNHSKVCMSPVRESDFTILCRDSSSEYNLQVKETLFIQREKPVLNIQGASVPVTNDFVRVGKVSILCDLGFPGYIILVPII